MHFYKIIHMLVINDSIVTKTRLISARHWSVIVRWLWGKRVRQNLTILEGCHFPQFYILIWSSFRKSETKDFNLDVCLFNRSAQTTARAVMDLIWRINLLTDASLLLHSNREKRKQSINQVSWVHFCLMKLLIIRTTDHVRKIAK